MNSRRFSFLLAALVMIFMGYVGGAVAQKGKPKPPPRVVDNGSRRITDTPTGVFDVGVKTLPTGFAGRDPMKIVNQLKEILAASPLKVDTFSTPQEIENYRNVMDRKFEPLGVIPLVVDLDKYYDAGNSSYTFGFVHKNIPYTYVTRLPIISQYKPLGTYVASNAFGVKAKVTRVHETQISVGFQSDIDSVEIIQKFKKFSVFVDSHEARVDNNNTVCLLLLKPTYPYIEENRNHIDPTINNPYDREVFETAIVGYIEQIWVFNKRTGKIYAKCRDECGNMK